MIHLTEAERALPLTDLLAMLKADRCEFIRSYPDHEAEFMAAQDRVIGEIMAERALD